MKIFIDFDDVLFDTGAFNAQFEKAFRACGVRSELFRKTYKKARKSEGIYVYDFDRHLNILAEDYGYDVATLRRAVEGLADDARQFVFADVDAFLAALARDGHTLYLVSFGAPSIQRGKIKGSGLEEYFEKIIVGQISKGEEVQKVLNSNNEESAVFLDDRVAHIEDVKANNVLIQTILVQRPEGRYHDERTDSCDFVVVDFMEIQEILSTL